jgi:hypothetical protein
MSYLAFEIGKVVYRRLALILLIATILIFPLLVKVISHLSVLKDKIPEGLFAINVATTVLLFSQTIVFIPIWMIVLVGLEFSSGHVNRVVFIKSREYYFLSKVAFTVLVTLFFSVLGIIAFTVATETSPFKFFHVPLDFYISFFAQLFTATLAYCILLLCLVYWLRSPVIAFVVYIAWSMVDGITYSVFKSLYNVELILPLQFVRTLYMKGGEIDPKNYYNPFVESPALVIGPLVMVGAILFFTYRIFIRRSLKPLSD